MKKIVFLSIICSCLLVINASAQNAPAPAGPAFSIADSASFTGKYKFEGMPFQYMLVSVKDGKLAFTGGEYSGPLNPVADKKDTFDANGNAVFGFLRDKDSKVNELKINYQGQEFTGKREPK